MSSWLHVQKKYYLLVLFLGCLIQGASAQSIRDFYYVEPTTKNLPVFIRGQLDSNKLLLYIQGGDADNGIDFGRSDYPMWKKTLETQVAIAYFDQRGLNRPTRRIDTSKINQEQVLQDIIAIAQSLQKRYGADIYLLGHSKGGVRALQCLAQHPDATAFIKGAIICNAPITTDFSPKRYNHYRPLYLKNLAKAQIAAGKDSVYWQTAYAWMEKTDSIASPAVSKQWNTYVDQAHAPYRRKINLGMLLKVIFSRPYHPFQYFHQKDNKLIADRLWFAERALWAKQQQTTLWEQLPTIQTPILLMTGQYDAVAVPEEQLDAHQLLQHSTLVVLPDAGHEAYLEQPQLFYDHILSFLQRPSMR